MQELWSTDGIFVGAHNRRVPARLFRRVTVPSKRTLWETAAMIEVASRIGFHLVELEQPVFDALFIFDELDTANPDSTDDGSQTGIQLVIGSDAVWLKQVLGKKAEPIVQSLQMGPPHHGALYRYQDLGMTTLVVTGTAPECVLHAAHYLVTDGFGDGIQCDQALTFVPPNSPSVQGSGMQGQFPGAKRDLSLHTLFTKQGVYRTSPRQLHPELNVLFDVVCSDFEETVAAIELVCRLSLSAASICFPMTRTPEARQSQETDLVISVAQIADGPQQSVQLTPGSCAPTLQISARKGHLIALVRKMMDEWFDEVDVLEADTWRQRFAMLQSESSDLRERAQLAMRLYQVLACHEVSEIVLPVQLGQPLAMWERFLQLRRRPKDSNVVRVEERAPVWSTDWRADGELAEIASYVEAFFAGVAEEGMPEAAAIEVTTTVSTPSFATWSSDLQSKLHQQFGVRVSFVYRNANKSGLHWLMHEVLPELKERTGVHRVELAARAFRPEVAHIDHAYRFLQELYPGDAMISSELGIALEQVQLRLNDSDHAPMFQVIAYAIDGRPIGEWVWEGWARSAVYMPEKPELGRVLVPSAGCRIFCGTQVGQAADAWNSRQFDTSAFLFWQWYQAVVRQVEEREDLHPDAPKFMQLQCDVWMDAEDEKIPYLEEVNSCLEALHEDIYFYTLHAFSEHGRQIGDVTWDAPGGILPFMHAQKAIEPHATVQLYAFPTRAEVQCTVDGSPKTFLPFGRETFAGARVLGITWSEIGQSYVFEGLLDESVARACHMWLNAATGAYIAPANDDNPAVLAYPKSIHRDIFVNRDVRRWLERHQETIVGRALCLDYSFQGEPIWFVELYDVRSRMAISSPLKHALYKPTLFINARHHANEVSSTNAALQLIQSLSQERTLLERVNLVVVPLENADGANLHERMADEHPTWKLHAARYNACGLEFQDYRFRADTIFGESRVYEKTQVSHPDRMRKPLTQRDWWWCKSKTPSSLVDWS
uniref:M14 family zinc carboxypeptidase n=1 Tax=Alicyclobacillus suci TaxID=2816080 RepID=UPI001A901BB5